MAQFGHSWWERPSIVPKALLIFKSPVVIAPTIASLDINNLNQLLYTDEIAFERYIFKNQNWSWWITVISQAPKQHSLLVSQMA